MLYGHTLRCHPTPCSCLTPHQGNIWTLLLFRRRYGPSVGGMMVPLGSGKYFIAEHRLQQACPYYLLGSLLCGASKVGQSTRSTSSAIHSCRSQGAVSSLSGYQQVCMPL